MKFCPYCGKQVKEEDNYCENCGAKLEKENFQENAVETAAAPVENNKKGTPEWLLKMLSLISVLTGSIPFLCQFPLAIGCGIACLILDKEHKYRGRCIVGIVLGSVFPLIYVIWRVVIIGGLYS